jgi:hypothetical protein
MKNKLYLLLIIAGLLAAAQPVRAFDPGTWLSRGIMKLDTSAAEDKARKKTSSDRKHKDTFRQIKKYLKAETGKTSRR